MAALDNLEQFEQCHYIIINNMSNLSGKNKRNIIFKFVLIFVIILVLLTLLFYIFNLTIKGKGGNIELKIKTKEQAGDNNPPKPLTCTRTTRLKNDQKYDRALSLVYEKVYQGEEHQSVWTSYNYFPAQLVNCIKVDAKNVKAEMKAEGYFDFNNKDIRPDYFPVTIDAVTYEYSDDLTTALLLVHEITHVQQYIMRPSCYKEGKFKLGEVVTSCEGFCLNNEVAAFYSQLLFINQLNDEEKKSLYFRIENDKELHPQLEMLQTLQKSLNSQIIGDCDVYNHECIMRKINWKIQTILEESGAYDEQCSLN